MRSGPPFKKLIAAYIVGQRQPWWMLVLAGVSFQVQSVLDGCDDEIARLTYTFSDKGQWLDTIGDDVTNYSLCFDLAYGQAVVLGRSDLMTFGILTLVVQASPLGKVGRVLVPLCGKTLDMSFLAAAGFDVVGVEFVEEAARSYFAEAGVQPLRVEQDGFDGYQHGKVTIWVADVLMITSQVIGHVDAIYDRAAVVALPENLRTQYGRKLASLCDMGARLLLVTFEHDPATGPPFSVEAEDVQRLFGASFSPKLVERVDTIDESPRWKERGATRMAEAVWVGVRA